MDASIYCSLPLMLLLATAEAVEFCENGNSVHNLTVTKFGTEEYIAISGYPDPFTTVKNCSISLDIALNMPNAVHIEALVTECYAPYVIKGKIQEQILHQYQSCTRVNAEMMLYSNNVLYEYRTATGFVFLLKAGSGNGFNFSMTVYPLLSMEPTNSTVNLTTTPTAYITSHQGFPESIYSNNLHNKLTLTDIPFGYNVVIEFVDIRLGQNQTCWGGNSSNDALKVYKSLNSLLYECGDIASDANMLAPLKITTSEEPISLLLEFTTDAEGQFSGFLLRFTVIGYQPSESPPEATAITHRTTTQEDTPKSSQRVTTGEPETEHTGMIQTKATSSPPTEATKESQTETISRANATANDTVSESTASSPSSTTTNRSQLYTIAGGAGGGLLLLLIVIAVLACVVYRRSKNRKESSLRPTPHCVNSADAVDYSDEFEWRAEGETNMYLENPYFELEPPEHVEMQPQTDQNTSHAPPGGASSRTRSEPTGMDINAMYTPVVKKDKLEMVENSLYGSA